MTALLTLRPIELVNVVTMFLKHLASAGLALLTIVGCNAHEDTPEAPEPADGKIASQAPMPGPPQASLTSTRAVELGEMTPQEALKVDIEGCGTALRAASSAQLEENNYVWFDDFSKAVVLINTQKVILKNARTGLKDAQLTGLYQNADGTISVEQKLRRKGEFQGEVVEVEGDLEISSPQGKSVIAVLGSSGC